MCGKNNNETSSTFRFFMCCDLVLCVCHPSTMWRHHSRLHATNLVLTLFFLLNKSVAFMFDCDTPLRMTGYRFQKTNSYRTKLITNRTNNDCWVRYLRYPPKIVFLQFNEWVDEGGAKVEKLCSWVIDGCKPGVFPIGPRSREWFLDQRRDNQN